MKIHNKLRKITILILISAFIALMPASSFIPGFMSYADSSAEAEERITEEDTESVLLMDFSDYASYREQHKSAPLPVADILINAESMRASGSVRLADKCEGKDNVIIWEGQDGVVECPVYIPESGNYRISLVYCPIAVSSSDIECEIYINGEAPFSALKSLTFSRAWKDKENIRRDNRDNELTPEQIQSPKWIEEDVRDNQGIYEGAFSIYFEKGENLITLKEMGAGIAIAGIRVYNTPEPLSYKELQDLYKSRGYDATSGYVEKIQAEKAVEKSDPTLHPLYNRSSAITEFSHPTKIRLNTLGGFNWRYQGQWAAWEVEVPEDGLYEIGARYRQDYVRGFPVTRKLTVDGQLPFKEAERITFPYGTNWNIKMLGEVDSPYLIYLTRGKHEIKMECVTGSMADTLRIVQEAVFELNSIYRRIIIITGTNPDIYRDYNLEVEIPDLVQSLGRVSDKLDNVSRTLEDMLGTRGSEAAFLDELLFQLEDIMKDPETIKTRLERFRTNISSLAAWILKLREQPLLLDYIFIKSPDVKTPKTEAGIFKKIEFSILSFLGSFFEDYNAVGNLHSKNDSLKVWISSGRDQAQILKTMIDDNFTPETGIYVNLELVQSSLVEAVLAGRGPDVAVNVPRGQPVNLAMRGALVDLTEFEDYEEIRQRFHSSAMVPYTYRNGCFGLPITQVFHMMFYRKDILAELQIDVPQTWDDFYKIAPVIQRNNMQIGLPYQVISGTNLIDGGIGASNLFCTLLLQHGGKFYSEDLTTTAFSDGIAINAFKEWTDFYASYGYPLTYDFYNRFRSGEMPLAIQQYTIYNLLAVAAPEIENLWDMVPVPGVREQDGSINRKEAASGSAAIIFSKTSQKEEAWQFLKWWSSAQIQERFGRQLETLMGPAARYDTANMEAFMNLPWSAKEQKVLLEQWDAIEEVPEVPGGYYTSRSLDNAFREVVFDYVNPREAFIKHNRYINNEMERKWLEFQGK